MTIDRSYYELVSPKYIDWEFYSSYLDKEPPFGEIGLIVYVRTYSRFIDRLNRRETWCETILRNIEYSLSLDEVTLLEDKKEEAKLLFDMMFNLRGFPAGRSLWTSGTLQSLRDGSSSWNCTLKVIDSISAFSEIFYWLLIGAGTGFNIEDQYISQLPKLNLIPISHKIYKPLPSYVREEHTEITWWDDYLCYLRKEDLILEDKEYISNLSLVKGEVEIVVGDSKEAWCNSLRAYLSLLTNPKVTEINFVYDNVRDKGERIKVFGGRASGPQALVDLFNNIYKVINRCGGILDSLACLDIINSIGLNVVSGGVRRTSEIGLMGKDDKKVINAKVNLYTDPDKKEYKAIRSMSNNSILLYENPGLDYIREVMEAIKTNGEPGFWIIGNAQRLAESPIKGCNPCAEAGLDDMQSCNLTTKNVRAHIFYNPLKGKWEYDYKLGRETIELITRIGSRQTCATQWHPKWDATQKRDRLLGVSLTGLQDALDLLEWTDEELAKWYKWVKQTAIIEANIYHDQLGINRSARVTLMKPEGTISQLPTVSSGIHRAYSPYYYRRIRFSNTDPLAKVLVELGLKAVPENNQGDDLYSPQCTTWVFTFPVKTDAKIRAIDEDCITQLERYRLAQVNYADRGHNVSCTITIAPDEYELATQWLNDNWDNIIGVSFLPRFDPMEGGKAAYPLMPYEPITKEEYDELVSSIPKFTERELIDILSKFERNYEEETLDTGCSTGACPVR